MASSDSAPIYSNQPLLSAQPHDATATAASGPPPSSAPLDATPAAAATAAAAAAAAAAVAAAVTAPQDAKPAASAPVTSAASPPPPVSSVAAVPPVPTVTAVPAVPAVSAPVTAAATLHAAAQPPPPMPMTAASAAAAAAAAFGSYPGMVFAPPDPCMDDQPTYVNPKQYARILKRRESRKKQTGTDVTSYTPRKRSYMHESRHKHAMQRRRGPGGRFLSKQEDQQISRPKEAAAAGQ